MKLSFLAAPFLSETTVAGYQAPGGEPGKSKQVLSFGPIATPKGQRIENITRGADDLFKYESGQLYDVPVLTSCYKDNIYFRTAGGSEKSSKKA